MSVNISYFVRKVTEYIYPRHKNQTSDPLSSPVLYIETNHMIRAMYIKASQYHKFMIHMILAKRLSHEIQL